MNTPTFNLLIALCLLLTAAACKTPEIESAANTLNRDLDLARSPYQYKVTEEKDRLIRVLRKMPIGETVANDKLRADVEKVIESLLKAPPKIVEIRIFETQAIMRREIWVAEHNAERVAFDIVLQKNGTRVDFTVKGPVTIEGAL